MKTYRALVHRDEDSWIVEVPEVRAPGRAAIVTETKRLSHVEATARDAVAALLDVPADSFVVAVELRLDDGDEKVIRRAAEARHRAEAARADAEKATLEAVLELTMRGVSHRDTGQLLGISHQRVSQLASSAA